MKPEGEYIFSAPITILIIHVKTTHQLRDIQIHTYYLAHNYRNRILHNISALRQPNLKNYMRSVTALKIPSI